MLQSSSHSSQLAQAMVGKTLGHYRVIEKLGAGGVGIVYLAQDTHLDRSVAIKVLHSEAVADLERKRRFVQEARAASGLNHPSIITIHDISQSDGVDFIVMEYVGGKTLDQLIRRKGLLMAEALKYAVQIAAALAAAHAPGIVHRDLKPAAVLQSSRNIGAWALPPDNLSVAFFCGNAGGYCARWGGRHRPPEAHG